MGAREHCLRAAAGPGPARSDNLEEVMMAQLSQPQVDAAQEFVAKAIELLNTDQGVHAETIIAASARMAGTFLFRSFAFPLPGVAPGQAVLSERANEQGPQLIAILGGVLTQVGIALDSARLHSQVPQAHQPLRDFLDTQRMFEEPFTSIMQRQGLSYQGAALAAAVATALLIGQCATVLDPHIAFAVAAYGFVEGSKTAPDPVIRRAA